VEIKNTSPEDWSPLLLEAWAEVVDDPAKWAKAAEAAGAELIVLAFSQTDKDGNPITPEGAVKTVKAVLAATGLPLIVFGPGQAEVDNNVLVPIAEATKGERLVLGVCEDKNYRTIVATAMANGHLVDARSPMDVNLAKQLNILISDMGMPLDRIIMDPTTGALGYGIEYTYSVMERDRLTALKQGDDKMQLPLICDVAKYCWKTREAGISAAEEPTFGDAKVRGVLWETTTAADLLAAGADVLILRHPESVRIMKKIIDDVMA
jgi:CO dehydrogenase/acetyl-CoA synthase delta subunit